MTKHVVTGAVVQVPATQVDGSKALTYAYRGAVVDLDADMAGHLLSVGLVAKATDVGDDPVVAAGAAQANVAVGAARLRPADDADPEEWVAHAVASGLPEADARAASREDLVAIFGDQSPTRRTRRRTPADGKADGEADGKADGDPAGTPAGQ